MFKTRWSWMHSGRLRMRRTMLSSRGIFSKIHREIREDVVNADRPLHKCCYNCPPAVIVRYTQVSRARSDVLNISNEGEDLIPNFSFEPISLVRTTSQSVRLQLRSVRL